MIKRILLVNCLLPFLMSPEGGEGDGGAGGAGDDDQFKKLKTEKENWRKSAEDAKTENETLRNQLKELQTNELKSKEDYKKLSEIKEAESKDWQKKYNELDAENKKKDAGILMAQKNGAIRKELGKNGVDEKAIDKLLKLVDLDSVKIDSETNAVYGVDEVVKSLRESLPMVFGTTKHVPGGGSPSGTTGTKLTMEEFKKLPLAEKKKRQHELY